MSSHDLDNESARVRRSCRLDVVDHFADTGEGRVAANGGIGAGQVIVNGSDETDDVQVPIRRNLLEGQLLVGNELLDQ